MNRQDPLFLLIKSLNSGERAAVRQIDHKDAAYLCLFDLIARSADFDERKLKKRLSAAGHEIHFSYAKNYLTKHILKVLAELRYGQSLDRAVAEVQVLMERKVFGLASKMLQKIMEQAWETERWALFLELSKMQMELQLMEGGDLEEGLEAIRALNGRRVLARHSLLQLGEYEDLYAAYRPVVKRKQVARNQVDVALILELKEHALLAATEVSSARVRRARLQLEVLVDVYLAEYPSALAKLMQQIQLYEEHDYLRVDHLQDYLNDLLRAGGLLLHFKRYVEVEDLLSKILAFQSSGSVHGSEVFDKYNRLLIALAIETSNPARILPAYDEILEGLNTYRDSLPLANKMSFKVLLARFQIELGNYTEARLILDDILREAEPGVREDIVSLARVLLVLIFWEKGDLDLAESASKAARKYLQRKDLLFAFERRLLRFFEASHGVQNDLGLLLKLQVDLEEIFKDPKEASILGLFDLRAWLSRRIESSKP